MPKITGEKKVPINRTKKEVVTEPAEAEVNGVERKIVYPKLEMVEYSSTSEQGPVTPADMKVILGWETEPQYQARMMLKYPDTKATDYLFYDDFHCIDRYKRKVRCNNNAGNRPFDMEWCEDLIRMTLRGEYAGPLTFPGETVNGETIRISRYGDTLSGQHQGTGLILADEDLQRSRDKELRPFYDPNDSTTELYPFWAGHEHCVIETIIITGLSNDERILRTIDYVKPRSVADMLFTMELYRNNTPVERKEMTRMLAAAIELLMTRTDYKGYRTHPEIIGFLERHRTLLDCVQHLFLENKPVSIGSKKKLDGESDQAHTIRLALQASQGGRRISKLHLSAGQCAAICFLQGCSATDQEGIDNYRGVTSEGLVPPNEKSLDFSMMDKAKEFWTKLAGDRGFVPVRTKLNALILTDPKDEDKEDGLGGRWEEKMAVIAKAWRIFKDHPDEEDNPTFPYEIDPETNKVISDDLEPGGELFLTYSDKDSDGKPMPEGKIRLIDIAEFFGIDCAKEGSKKQAKKVPPVPTKDPTPEEIYAQGERMRHEKIAKEDEKKESKRKIKRK